MPIDTDHDAQAMLARQAARTPDQQHERAWTSSVDLWLHLRSEGREIDGAVILLAAWGLARDQPLEPSQMASLLHTTDPMVLAAIARLEKDGHARFVRKQ